MGSLLYSPKVAQNPLIEEFGELALPHARVVEVDVGASTAASTRTVVRTLGFIRNCHHLQYVDIAGPEELTRELDRRLGIVVRRFIRRDVMDEPAEVLTTVLVVVLRVRDEKVPHLIELLTRRDRSFRGRTQNEEFLALLEQGLGVLNAHVMSLGITADHLRVLIG